MSEKWESVQEDLFLAAGRDEAVWLERAQGELCWLFLDLWVYMGSRWTGRLNSSIDCMELRQSLFNGPHGQWRHESKAGVDFWRWGAS